MFLWVGVCMNMHRTFCASALRLLPSIGHQTKRVFQNGNEYRLALDFKTGYIEHVRCSAHGSPFSLVPQSLRLSLGPYIKFAAVQSCKIHLPHLLQVSPHYSHCVVRPCVDTANFHDVHCTLNVRLSLPT